MFSMLRGSDFVTRGRTLDEEQDVLQCREEVGGGRLLSGLGQAEEGVQTLGQRLREVERGTGGAIGGAGEETYREGETWLGGGYLTKVLAIVRGR